MSDDFFEIPGATGDNGGGSSGQGASDAAPADRNSKFEERLERMGKAIESLTRGKEQDSRKAERDEVARKIAGAIQGKIDEVSKAEKALAEAYEDGEGVEIAKAQRRLGELTAEVERMKAEGRNHLAQYDSKASEEDEIGDTTNLDKWRDRNAMWYGVDAEMTKAAHEIDAVIRKAGALQTGSNEYFEAIDRQMQKRFPDRLKGSPGGASQTTETTGSSRGVTRVPKAIVDGWKRMGINMDDPETAKRMLKHRQTAASKGILPEEPRYGRVMD